MYICIAMRFFIIALFAYRIVCVQCSIHEVDVAIIGGGLAGLSVAKDLTTANKSFAILEARSRVGGRLLNANFPGKGAEELGGEYVGPTQDRVLALISELGLKTYKTFTAGDSMYYRNGTLQRYIDRFGGIPPVGIGSLIELAGFMNEINTLASTINLEEPWNSPNATILDSMTLETFINSRIFTTESRMLLGIVVPGILSVEAREPSLLYALWGIAGSGNATTPGSIGRLIATDEGAQDSRVIGGSQMLAIKLAENLGRENIFFNAPVRKVKLEHARYIVTSPTLNISAKHVVVAISPPLASRIVFDPPLPAGRAQLNQRMPIGAIGKAIAIFPRPWWRGQGLNGAGISDTGAIRVTYDNSPPNVSFGALMGFIEADEMRKLDSASDDEIKLQAKQSFVNLFGSQVDTATEILIHRWDTDQFSRGGPAAFMPPGVLTQYGPFLRAPVGKIHFAGTETAVRWVGYMDGAISSGERAAAEILDNF
ncbi:unnamed protein product [Penicillium salamii]|uniref:Amine oxidase n=1 Tax=Penicillium salamii TaxID=1612424 RepID=A0A9W4JEX0_9EURO|nr:unnamed protein product [Penicillium salamii]CAG8385423.1 unnamed protein product [Penicillium salamii]CAG8395479.1 unnamed protein product [Penicillium salamii]CAG8415357.1 unnamed protein product [Penicillium salamii]